jgi:hypothetical protein
MTFVLDRSGSMQDTASDTIGGYNKFLADQKALPGDCQMSLAQFDHEYEVRYEGKLLKDVPDLTSQTYVPRGQTALLDAVGRTINRTGERLGAMPEADRPEHVVFVIITDGLENHSREFTKAQIKEMIEHQTNAYKWHFVYLGANQDAFAEACAMGIKAANALGTAQNTVGISRYYDALHTNARKLRGGEEKTMGFVDIQREAQKEAGAVS